MTDDRLQALARRFAQTGALEDEVDWLKERVRSGGLSPEQLRAAACLGHLAARDLSPVELPGLEFSAWVLAWPTEAGVPGVAEFHQRGVVALARGALGEPSAALGAQVAQAEAALRAAPEQVEDWIETLAPEVEAEFRLLVAERQVLRGSREESDFALLEFKSVGQPEAPIGRLCAAAHDAVLWNSPGDFLRALELGEESLGLEEAKQALASELIPWLLGYRDPLQERVRRRAEA